MVEWQFTNPHTFIILAVEDDNGEEVIWSLEGGNTSLVFRRGWTPESLQPGDELIVTVRPLHSGAPGGNYSDVRNADGTPFRPQGQKIKQVYPAHEYLSQNCPFIAFLYCSAGSCRLRANGCKLVLRQASIPIQTGADNGQESAA